ncbi:hypothetical protein Tco_0407879 [Tanacetum coccineum]
MQLIQKLRDDKKCMKKVEPSSISKAIKDIISIGSFMEALVLNHYVLVRKILWRAGKRARAFACLLDETGRCDSPEYANVEHKPDYKVSSLAQVQSPLEEEFDLTP